MPTIRELLRQGTASLMGHSGSPRLDADLILGHVLNQAREYLIAHDEQAVSLIDEQVYIKLLTLRQKGMPLPYILGKRGFFDRQFIVTSHVLIPRPETEHLVEAALAWAVGRSALHIVDVGTGSGIIAVSLAARLPTAHVLAVDVSAAALSVAQLNGADLPNLHYAQSDLLSALHGPFDLICANLPYIATGEMNILDVAKFEPHVALDGGVDGLYLIRRLLAQAPTRLAPNSLILLEIGADQGPSAAAAAQAALPQGQVEVLRDYAGLDRVVRIAVSSSHSEDLG